MQLSRLGRRTRTLFVYAIALLTASVGLVTSGAGKASAYVGPDRIAHVYMNVGESGSDSQQSQYQGLIDSLRAVTGAPYRGGTFTTQANDYGLIRLSLHRTATNDEVSLWLDPVNLYVLGFSNRYNQTWAFNDPRANTANLAQRLIGAGQSQFQLNGNVQWLPFGGGYGSLTASSGTDRWTMQHNYDDLIGSLTQLSRETNPTGGQNNNSPQTYTARSLLFMISFTSEAARFYDINGVFRATTVGTWAPAGLSGYQQELENSWDPASVFGQRVTNDPTTAPVVVSNNPYIAYNNWNDITSRIAVLLSTYYFVPDKGQVGNWWSDQL